MEDISPLDKKTLAPSQLVQAQNSQTRSALLPLCLLNDRLSAGSLYAASGGSARSPSS